MTIREWRDKRLHRRCLFCTYYCAAHPLGPPYETKNTGWCRAKSKNVNDDIPKWFCALYRQKEGGIYKNNRDTLQEMCSPGKADVGTTMLLVYI